jgi:hypothetical protein
VTQRSGVTTSNGGEIASRRGKRTDDARWAYRDLIVPKNEKKSTQLIHLLQMNGEYLNQ